MRISCITVLLFILSACSSAGGDTDPGSGGPVGVPPQITVLAANDGVNGAELWKTDGTAAGTVLVKDINPISGAGSDPAGFTEFNGAFYFSADDGVHGFELWKTDGTAAGTVLVKDINTSNGTDIPPFGSSSPHGFTVFNGALYFTAFNLENGDELWKTDGTTAGTVLVADILGNPFPPEVFGASSSPHGFTEFNGALYFNANGGSRISGLELYKTDGTAAGTGMVKDIRFQGPGSSDPGGFTVFNGALYFGAEDDAHGRELWKTDGTAAGTVQVKDINPTARAGSLPDGFTVFNGALYFGASDDVNGFALWKTDGTDAGTVLVKSGNYYPSGFTVFNGALYFRFVQTGVAPFCGGGVNNFELWKTDGTAAGTVVVKNFNATSGVCSTLSAFTELNGALYFNANSGLWKSDGTAAGTVLVKDINPVAAVSPALDSSLFVLNGALYFKATDGVSGMEFWKSDGTTAGTQLLKDICPGACSGTTGF